MRNPIYINQGRKDVIYQGRWYNKDGSIPPVLLAHATRGALLTYGTFYKLQPIHSQSV
jgi:hypothetical protein